MERKEGKWGGEGREKLATARFKPRNNSQGACYVRWSTVFSFFSSSSSSSFFFLSLSLFLFFNLWAQRLLVTPRGEFALFKRKEIKWRVLRPPYASFLTLSHLACSHKREGKRDVGISRKKNVFVNLGVCGIRLGYF